MTIYVTLACSVTLPDLVRVAALSQLGLPTTTLTNTSIFVSINDHTCQTAQSTQPVVATASIRAWLLCLIYILLSPVMAPRLAVRRDRDNVDYSAIGKHGR